LYSTAAGESAYLTIKERDWDSLNDKIISMYIRKLNSFPKNPTIECNLKLKNHDAHMAFSVLCELNKEFCTSVGQIYWARCNDRRILLLDKIKLFGTIVQEYLKKAKMTEVSFHDMSSEAKNQTIKLMKLDKNKIIYEVKNEIANKYTKNITYMGLNNRSYSKYCNVYTEDVKTHCDTILYFTSDIELCFYKKKYNMSIIDDSGQNPLVFHSDGFGYSANDFFNGRASLCNDCGSITSANESHTCYLCKRTLCSEHIWSIPVSPFRKIGFCHLCFKAVISGQSISGIPSLKHSDLRIIGPRGSQNFVKALFSTAGMINLLCLNFISILFLFITKESLKIIPEIFSNNYSATSFNEIYHNLSIGISSINMSDFYTTATFFLSGLILYYLNWSKRSRKLRQLKASLHTYSPAWP
jgi:hypothetical protein